MRKIASLYSDEGGASIIEMALILPVFTTMLHRDGRHQPRLFRRSCSSSNRATARSRRCSNIRRPKTPTRRLKNEAVSAANAAGFTDVTTSNVTVDYWLECDGVRQGNGTPGTATIRPARAASGTAAGSMSSLTHKFKPLFASNIWPGSNTDGTYTLHGQRGAADSMKLITALRSNERGAAAVEFALSVPVLVSMIWGIFQLALLFEANAGIQHALGEGARYATLY